MPFIVETMALSDLNAVMAIERLSFSAPWSERAYRYEIQENRHSTMLVVRPSALAGSRLACLLRRVGITGRTPVLGYGGFWLLVDEVHISTIAVDPAWRGKGLGEMVLLSLLEKGIGLHARCATLEVRVSNEVAQGLYRKYSFEIAGRQRRYYSDNNEDAFIMVTPPFDTAAFRDNLQQRRAELRARLQAGASRLDGAL
jgi:[ribosomal protein S18]-alanine N-acetyltransferase